MTQSGLVLSSVDNHVALITVNDPDRRNAVTGEMSALLRAAVEQAEADPGAHAVVITGAGKAFCAGADLSALGAAGGEATESGLKSSTTASWPLASASCPRSPRSMARRWAPASIWRWRPMSASSGRARSSIPGSKARTAPGRGATWMLQRAVGPQVARAALLFGMRFDAEAAVRHGLALSVADDPVAAALELAAGPAAAPRDVVIATKATMRATASLGSVDTEQHELAMRTELGPQATSIQSPEFAARLAAAQRR